MSRRHHLMDELNQVGEFACFILYLLLYELFPFGHLCFLKYNSSLSWPKLLHFIQFSDGYAN
jgi:hypothetical protein